MASKIVLLAVCLALSNAGVIIQSDFDETVTPGYLITSPFNHGPHMQIPGATVIWGFNPLYPSQNIFSFTEKFTPKCDTPITVKANADNKFKIALAGVGFSLPAGIPPVIMRGNFENEIQ